MVQAGGSRSSPNRGGSGLTPTRGPDPLRTPRSASSHRSPGSSSGRSHRHLSGGRDASSYDVHRHAVRRDPGPMDDKSERHQDLHRLPQAAGVNSCRGRQSQITPP